LQIADNQLGKTPYLAGNEITIADISLIIYVRVLFRLVFDEKTRSKIPNVVQWHNRLFEHKEISGFFGKNWLCTN
jgi:glutathione S-transferase